jgi:hypothetical protein
VNIGVVAQQPSVILRSLQRLYRTTGLRRAAGKLDWIPIGLLGGPVVWTKTESGDLVVRCRDHGARQLLLFGRYDNEVDENIIVRGYSARHAACSTLGQATAGTPASLQA